MYYFFHLVKMVVTVGYLIAQNNIITVKLFGKSYSIIQRLKGWLIEEKNPAYSEVKRSCMKGFSARPAEPFGRVYRQQMLQIEQRLNAPNNIKKVCGW